ncbi:MAG: hypothetical protein PWP07_299 [Epulopiscium sp.]|jgi:hypothetical protein|uniref:DUF4236 domain-containing protein n=1 Tax=Defluviitalea raffinosedens TaxID=1450156 RepID=A0A7C8LQ19_9FIRM|nr:DUF4236 domain-containing protein [Defluviitalea raffinosedens]KAE9634425.1 DUF4236 domain-containing protein [Defluviitalea raffinosedens]MBZ4668889.1 hypothetical protein [Defluviitaleaceae bacterium]MDK2787074.1 hypothetical protein [Candidatus Epulonipiscium sp.]
MGLRMRKSIKLGKGVRVNFGKKGASLSFGTKGLRYSIHSSGRRTSSIGIPGTGISYVTSSGGKKRKYTSSAYDKRQQIQMQKVQQVKDERQKNALLVEEYNNLIEVLRGIHKECDETVDWHHIYSLKEPFSPQEIGPKQAKARNEFENYKPRFLEKLIKPLREKKELVLKEAIEKAAREDREDYEEWKKLHELAERIITGDIDAYLEVIDEMNPLDDLLEFGSDFEFGTDHPDVLEVEFKVKSETVVPNYSLSLTQTGKLSKKALSKTAYYEIVQDYVCSCAIRIARDMFALLPVSTVIVHAVDNALNTETGYHDEITILSVVFNREVLNGLNFEAIDPSDAMKNFRHNMKFMKTKGFSPVERISKY